MINIYFYVTVIVTVCLLNTIHVYSWNRGNADISIQGTNKGIFYPILFIPPNAKYSAPTFVKFTNINNLTVEQDCSIKYVTKKSKV